MKLSARHISFIMDGNRRWAKQNNVNAHKGHEAGLNKMMQIIEYFSKYDDSMYLSFYTFSQENWFRSIKEIYNIFQLITKHGNKVLQQCIDLNVKLNFIGDINNLPAKVIDWVNKVKIATAQCTGINVMLAINYSGRHDILNAIKTLKNDNNLDNIDETQFSKYLYTANVPDPDLCIRTGMQTRLSNFLLWQLAYAELEFVDCLWPDFSIQNLESILNKYHEKQRNFGM